MDLAQLWAKLKKGAGDAMDWTRSNVVDPVTSTVSNVMAPVKDAAVAGYNTVADHAVDSYSNMFTDKNGWANWLLGGPGIAGLNANLGGDGVDDWFYTRDAGQEDAFGKYKGDEYGAIGRLNDIVSQMSPEAQAIWAKFDDATKETFLSEYLIRDDDWGNLFGLTGARQRINREAFEKDLNEMVGVDFLEEPDYEAILQQATADVDAEFAKIYDRYDEEERLLDDLLATRQAEYAEDMSNIRQDYSTARQGILSQQAAQNARLADTMTSEMSKARQSALEAGASAGIRLAGNVNAMLSTQNKQAQTSLDTSNQLAQMLLNQRNAERGARNDYNSYMQQDASNRADLNANRSDLDLNRYDRITSRAKSEYDTAYDTYSRGKAAEEQKYVDNGLYEPTYARRNN